MDRSDEDWSFLCDPALRADPWDPVKYIPLGREGWFLSLSGEFRPMYEFYKNYNWGTGPQDGNGFYLNRLIGHADFHFGETARVFFELKSGLVFSRNGGPRPSIDKDNLEVSQLFFDLNLHLGKSRLPLTVRLGRQELNYGESTLVSIRELNVRREFDGVKLVFRPEGWKLDAFAVKPVQVKPGFFDDPPDHAQTLWGVWAKRTKGLPKLLTQLDVYYLGLDRKRVRFDQGTARDQRHTLGVNAHGKKGDFSYFVEGDLQLGKFGNGRLLAWKYAQILSYGFPKARFFPVVSLLGAISSGDQNPARADLQTFHPLFPKGLYYGYMDFTSGSLNAIVVHPKITLQLSEAVSLNADSFFFWRQRASDGIYSQPGFFLRTGQSTRARYIGALQDLDVVWRVNRHTSIQFIAAYYEVGPYLRETLPAGENTTYLSLKMNYKF
ncbi:MAG: alginate export family protein [Verrucomicrobiales bacterium]|nr:alginate export family protein [Verrucomicrobiales bacterium]